VVRTALGHPAESTVRPARVSGQDSGSPALMIAAMRATCAVAALLSSSPPAIGGPLGQAVRDPYPAAPPRA
jgi:hypothetical protein